MKKDIGITKRMVAEIVNTKDEYLKQKIRDWAKQHSKEYGGEIEVLFLDEEKARRIIELGIQEFIKNTETVLDVSEKEYLGNLVKPFRERVRYIKKCAYGSGTRLRDYSFISLGVDDFGFCLPRFKKGTMYNGMKLDKEYSLEELGL